MAQQKTTNIVSRLISKVSSIANQIRRINSDIADIKASGGATNNKNWTTYTPGNMSTAIQGNAVVIKVNTEHPLLDAITLIGIAYGEGSVHFANGAGTRVNLSTGKAYDVYWSGGVNNDSISATFIQKKDVSDYHDEFTPTVLQTNLKVLSYEWRPL